TPGDSFSIHLAQRLHWDHLSETLVSWCVQIAGRLLFSRSAACRVSFAQSNFATFPVYLCARLLRCRNIPPRRRGRNIPEQRSAVLRVVRLSVAGERNHYIFTTLAETLDIAPVT